MRKYIKKPEFVRAKIIITANDDIKPHEIYYVFAVFKERFLYVVSISPVNSNAGRPAPLNYHGPEGIRGPMERHFAILVDRERF